MDLVTLCRGAVGIGRNLLIRTIKVYKHCLRLAITCMASLGVGHKRARSASTTTAIQRPSSSVTLTTRTMSSTKTMSVNRPRRSSTEGMSGLPITVNVDTRTRRSRITSYIGWLWSMASSKGENNGDSLASSSTSSLSGPPSPANITALADWSPRAAHHHVSEPRPP
jgi:hypothetical protein